MTWVNVSCNLPPEFEPVLFVTTDRKIPVIGRYYGLTTDDEHAARQWSEESSEENWYDEEVTHWMPLPVMPGRASHGSFAAHSEK